MSEPVWWEVELEGSGDEWWDTVSKTHSDWWHIEGGSESDWWEMSQTVVEGEWIEGVSKSLPIVWFLIEDYIPVDETKEIVGITVQPETEEHPSGGHFDDFGVFRSLMMDKLYGNEEEMICLEEVSSYPYEIPIFPAVTDRQIKAVYIMPMTTAVPGDGTVTISIVNEANDGVVCTATVRAIAGDELTAYVPRQFGGISNYGDMKSGQGLSLKLVLSEGTSFTVPRSIIVIHWDVADWGEE